MGFRKELAGKRFGKLTVIEFSHVARNRNLYWKCKCVCGKEKNIKSSHLTSGAITSCGKGECNKSVGLIRNPKGKPVKEITWEVNENGCWICTSHAPNSEGYPRIGINKKRIYLSRYMYEKYKGEFPKGYDMCHKCDTPMCINPDHLFPGTRKDNVNDCIQKDRNIKGEDCSYAKLTEKQVYDIKYGYDGLMHKEIALIYNVSHGLISMIKNNKRWKHI